MTFETLGRAQSLTALTTASVKEVRSSAASLSPYMDTKKMRRRLKEMRREMMRNKVIGPHSVKMSNNKIRIGACILRKYWY